MNKQLLFVPVLLAGIFFAFFKHSTHVKLITGLGLPSVSHKVHVFSGIILLIISIYLKQGKFWTY